MSTENSTLPCCGNKVCLILHSKVFRQALEESRNSFDTIVSISCYCSCNVLLSKALHLSNIVVTQKKLWVCLLSQIYMIYKIVVYSWSWSRAKWNMITGVNSENLPSVFPEQGVKSLWEHLHPVRKWLVGVLASPLLIQLPDNMILGRQQWIAQVHVSLTPRWEIRDEFLSLGLPWPCPGCGEHVGKWNQQMGSVFSSAWK